jgi:WD40 repeat protein
MHMRPHTHTHTRNQMLEPLVLRFLGHFKGIFSIQPSHMDDIVLTGGADGTIRIYERQSGVELRRIDAHSSAVRRCCLSPNNRFALSASAGGTAMLWDIASTENVGVMQGHEGEVMDGCWLDDSVIVTAGNDGLLISWRVQMDGAVSRWNTFIGHESAVTCVIDTAKGTQVVSGSYDKTIRVWDAVTTECLLVLAGHRGVVYGLAVAPNGARLLSCSSDETLKVVCM